MAMSYLNETDPSWESWEANSASIDNLQNATTAPDRAAKAAQDALRSSGLASQSSGSASQANGKFGRLVEHQPKKAASPIPSTGVPPPSFSTGLGQRLRTNAAGASSGAGPGNEWLARPAPARRDGGYGPVGKLMSGGCTREEPVDMSPQPSAAVPEAPIASLPKLRDSGRNQAATPPPAATWNGSEYSARIARLLDGEIRTARSLTSSSQPQTSVRGGPPIRMPSSGERRAEPVTRETSSGSGNLASPRSSEPKQSSVSLVPTSVSDKRKGPDRQQTNTLHSILNGHKGSHPLEEERVEPDDATYTLPEGLDVRQREDLDEFVLSLPHEPVFAGLKTKGIMETSPGIFEVKLRGRACLLARAEIAKWVRSHTVNSVAVSTDVQGAGKGAASCISQAHDMGSSQPDLCRASSIDNIEAAMNQNIHSLDSPPAGKSPSSAALPIAGTQTASVDAKAMGAPELLANTRDNWHDSDEAFAQASAADEWTLDTQAEQPNDLQDKETYSAGPEVGAGTTVEHPQTDIMAGVDASHMRTSPALFHYLTPHNSIAWFCRQPRYIGRLIGPGYSFLRAIAEISGVAGVFLRHRTSTDRRLYVLGSCDPELSEDGWKNVFVAVRIIAAACWLLDVRELAPLPHGLSAHPGNELRELPHAKDKAFAVRLAAEVRARFSPPRTTLDDIALLSEHINAAARSGEIDPKTMSDERHYRETSAAPSAVDHETAGSPRLPRQCWDGFAFDAAYQYGGSLSMFKPAGIHGRLRIKGWLEQCSRANSFNWVMPNGRARIALYGPNACNLYDICREFGVRIFTTDTSIDFRRMFVMFSEFERPTIAEVKALIGTVKFIRALCFLTGQVHVGPQPTDLPAFLQDVLPNATAYDDTEKEIFAHLLPHYRLPIIPTLKSIREDLEPLLQYYGEYASQLAKRLLISQAWRKATVAWAIPDGVLRDRIVQNLGTVADICKLKEAWADPLTQSETGQEGYIYLQGSFAGEAQPEDIKRLRLGVKAIVAICAMLGRLDLAPEAGDLPSSLFGGSAVLSEGEAEVAQRWQDMIADREGGIRGNTDEDIRGLIDEIVRIGIVDAEIKAETPVPPAQAAISTSDIALAQTQPEAQTQAGPAEPDRRLDAFKDIARSVIAFLDDPRSENVILDSEWLDLIQSLRRVSIRLVDQTISPQDSMSQVIAPDSDGHSERTVSELRRTGAPAQNGWKDTGDEAHGSNAAERRTEAGFDVNGELNKNAKSIGLLAFRYDH